MPRAPKQMNDNFLFLNEKVNSLSPVLAIFICSLDALDPNAYEAFKASRNLHDVVERVLRNQQESQKVPGLKRTLSVQATLMTPVQPMLVCYCFQSRWATLA